MSHEVKGSIEATAPVGGPPPSSELDAPLPTKKMLVNLGPSHPAMHGTTRAVVELEGEKLASLKLDIGFLHRGFEKSCENVTWTQCFPYTDRLNYVSSIMNNVGFAMAV
jgi:NADH-quinone oxidoreductase subunit D